MNFFLSKADLISGLISIGIVIASFCGSNQYVRSAKAENLKRSQSSLDKRRQSLVKENRDIVGVSNFGTSMDDDPIYLVSLKDLGTI